jgi:hypothetical protein
VWLKGHRHGGQSELLRAPNDSLDDLLVTEMKAVEIADA